jgi:5'-3' exonuclease
MGVNGLHDILKKYAPEIYKTKKLKEYAYKKVAIDTTLYLYKYKAILGDKWLNGFLNLISCLRKNNLHAIFIEDGKPPQEKSNERKKRSEQKEKLEEKIYLVEEAINNYHLSGEINPILFELSSKDDSKAKKLLGDQQVKRINIFTCEAYLKKLKLQNVKITKDDFKIIETLFEILDVPFYKPDMEAETFCCWICKNGIVDAVLSEDTDVLAYGTPLFLTKINTNEESVIEINFQELIKILDLTEESFRDLCILCGNDYNDNMKGIGPDKGYKLIKGYLNIEEIEKIKGKEGENKFDTSVLNYHRTRQLFTVPSDFKFEIKYCGKPNISKLRIFLFENNISYNIESLVKCFQPPEIVLED